MTNNTKAGSIRKRRFLTILAAIVFIFAVSMENGFSDDAKGLDEQQASNSASSGVGQNQQERDDISALRDKVSKLEKTVSDQAALIEQQKQILNKVIESMPQVKASVTPPEPKTLVKKFVVDNANLFTAKELEAVLGKYRDKELSMTDLKKAAEDITALYRKKGYVTSYAYVPPQEITDNVVEFKVVEGRVGDIQVEKPKYSRVKTIEKEFMVEPGQILNSKNLEVNLQRINTQQDRTIKTVLLPGKTPESPTPLLLKVDKESSPHHFYAEFNNRGTSYTGQNRWGLGYLNTNLTKNDDNLSVRLISSLNVEVCSFSGAYDLPVSRYNTRLGVYGAYSKADIGGQFAVLSPQGRGQFYGLYVSHPWLNKTFGDDDPSAAVNLKSNFTGGFDWINVRNKALEQETSHDEARVFKGGINFEEIDELGRANFTAEARFGVPELFGAMGKHDVSASRVDAGGKFQIYTASASRISRIFTSPMFFIDTFKYQYSPNVLISSEQMIFGGADSIRGYPEADYLADYGWMNTAELRLPVFFMPSSLKVPFDKDHNSLVDALQFVTFLDAGQGHINGVRTGEDASKYFVGAGVGLRFDFYKHFHGWLDAGFPMGDKPSDGSTETTYFGLKYDW